jgi:hypothetical protein
MTCKRFLACSTGVLLSLAIVSAAAAQAPPAPPKPGPEHQELKYFVGKWTSEGEAKPSPMMPGGKFSSTDNCELWQGGFYVVCHSTGKGPMGPSTELGIMGYDSKKKVYTYYGISNHQGMADTGEGKVEGDQWIYMTPTMEMPDGKKLQGRYVISNKMPTSYNFKFETAPEGSTAWETMMEGKATKAGGKTESKTDGETPKKSDDKPSPKKS